MIILCADGAFCPLLEGHTSTNVTCILPEGRGLNRLVVLSSLLQVDGTDNVVELSGELLSYAAPSVAMVRQLEGGMPP